MGSFASVVSITFSYVVNSSFGGLCGFSLGSIDVFYCSMLELDGRATIFTNTNFVNLLSQSIFVLSIAWNVYV